MFQENPDIMEDVRPHAGRRLEESSVKLKGILEAFQRRMLTLSETDVFEEAYHRPRDMYASVLRETKDEIIEDILYVTFANVLREQPLLIGNLFRQEEEMFHLLPEASAFRDQAEKLLRAKYQSKKPLNWVWTADEPYHLVMASMYHEGRQVLGMKVEKPMEGLLMTSELSSAPDPDLERLDLPKSWTLDEVKLVKSLHERNPTTPYEMIKSHHLPKKSCLMIINMAGLIEEAQG